MYHMTRAQKVLKSTNSMCGNCIKEMMILDGIFAGTENWRACWNWICDTALTYYGFVPKKCQLWIGRRVYLSTASVPCLCLTGE